MTAMGRLRPVGTGTKRQILTPDSLSNRDADRQARLGVSCRYGDDTKSLCVGRHGDYSLMVEPARF